MTREVEVRYRLTPEEQQTASGALIRLTRGEPAAPWMTPVILVFLGLAALVVLYFQSGALDAVTVAVVVLVMCLAGVGSRWIRRRDERSIALHLPEQDMYYRFSDEWIEDRGETGESRTKWALVERAVKLPKGYVLFLANGVFYWVPRHAMSEVDQQTMDDMLSDNVSAVTDLTAREQAAP